MSDEVDSRVSPALHPLNVRQVDGYSEETAPLLAPTEAAFLQAYQACRDVHNAREMAAQNPAWTEGNQIIMTDALARKYLDRVTRAFDIARGRLAEGVSALERDLSAPVASKASLQIAQEIRAHCKALPSDGDRITFVRGLITSGDELSASAILGGPAFLSGLKPEQSALFTRMYHEKTSPSVARRVTAMKAAMTLIERNAPIVFTEFERAVGCPAHKAKALREADTAAQKAMVMRDLA